MTTKAEGQANATTLKKKPPTQVAGVVGIEPLPVHESPDRGLDIDWAKLCGLPAFQMFAIEQSGNHPSTVDSWMDEWFRDQINYDVEYYPLKMYADYCQWHRDKGYWPNETPCGELTNDS